MSPVLLIAGKESGELLLSPRGLGWLLAVAAVLSGFALLLIGDSELSLLDDAQVVYDMAAIVTALGALVALLTGVDAIGGERERRSLVPLLLTPVSRDTILAGKLLGVAIAWATMYLLAVPYLWAVGGISQNLVEGCATLALVGTPVVLGFGFFGIGLGASLATPRSGVLIGLIALLLAASPLLLGPSLRQSAIGQLFDSVNPFSAAVNAYDAVIVDSRPIAGQRLNLAVTLAWVTVALAFARVSVSRVTH